MDLSILIVTYNPGDIFSDCLTSIQETVEALSYEIIVVDNASTDGTPERLAESYPDIHLVANPDNRGFARANNQGLALAKGKYLLLLNPDVIVHADALSILVEFLGNQPEAGIVGPRTYTGNGHIALTARVELSALTVLWEYWKLSSLFPNAANGRYRRACREATDPFTVEWVQGSCLMLKRPVYEQIGGLDEDIFLFTEEADFCERAFQAGWLTYYVPAATITHYESTVVSRFHLRRVRNYHRSPILFFRKRGQLATVIILKLGFSLELGAKILLRIGQQIAHPCCSTAPCS